MLAGCGAWLGVTFGADMGMASGAGEAGATGVIGGSAVVRLVLMVPLAASASGPELELAMV
eukprot:6214554-Alexandrium_andersonii.AAC.1